MRSIRRRREKIRLSSPAVARPPMAVACSPLECGAEGEMRVQKEDHGGPNECGAMRGNAG